MGRLDLNVLAIPFAIEFEREVIGERGPRQDRGFKIQGHLGRRGRSSHSGYASVNKKLVVVPEEAENRPENLSIAIFEDSDPFETSSRTWIGREFVRGG